MKKKFFILVAMGLLLMAGFQSSHAQLKIGYLNSQELLSIMPERDSLQKVFDAERETISRRLEEMQVEYNTKFDAYVNQRDSLQQFVRATKEQELQDIENRIRTYDQTAAQELQRRQSELLQPLFDKIQVAIKQVAEENGYTYILDAASLLYIPEDDETLNVLGLVKAKLGIQ